MVSFQKVLADSPSPAGLDASSNKRKLWEEPLAEEFLKDQTKTQKRKSIFDIELHLETPLPSDHSWQQYLSVQSGQVQYSCNTRMSRNEAEDHKKSLEEPPSSAAGHMSLDLELNLTCESVRKREGSDDMINNAKQNKISSSEESSKYKNNKGSSSSSSGGLTPPPSWLSSEGDHKEMVTTVCMRCHMLVMLCKSSPACPNCKFMHPPDQKPSTFLKRRCTLLC